MHDLLHNVLMTKTIEADQFTGNTPTDTQGQGVENTDFGVNAHLFSIGTSGDVLSGSLKLALSLKESDDSADGTSGDGTWTTVDDSEIKAYRVNGTSVTELTAVSDEIVIDDAAEDGCLILLDYKGNAKWSAPYVNFTGNHATGIELSAVALQTRGDVPVATV